MNWKALPLALLLAPCLAFGQAPTPAAEAPKPDVPKPDVSKSDAPKLDTVPHGELHRETYTTKYVKGLPGDSGTFVVYTPEGYDAAMKPAYPVLYLLHGWGDDVDGWVKRGNAAVTLDRMIANKRIKPMVVVMPLGYGDMSFLSNGFEVWRDEAQISRNVNLFSKTLLEEIMPQVGKNYDVAKDREHTAIAGLSMGGLEALTVGLRHADLFASVGGFSSAIFPVEGQDVTKLDPKAENMKLLYVACGTDDDLLSVNRIFVMHLKDAGFKVMEVETAGQHAWPVWRVNLHEFLPLLFKDDAAKKN